MLEKVLDQGALMPMLQGPTEFGCKCDVSSVDFGPFLASSALFEELEGSPGTPD